MAWVKDLALVWQPDWVLAITDWVRANINLPPLSKDWKLFDLDISLSNDDILHTLYANEQEFLNSEFGKSTLLFHFLRFTNVPIIMATIVYSFLDLMGYNGLNKFKISIHIESKMQFLKSYLWLSFLAFFCALMIFGGIILVQNLSVSAKMSMNIELWMENFYLNFCLVLVIISCFIVYSWLKMTKKIIVSFIRFLSFLF